VTTVEALKRYRIIQRGLSQVLYQTIRKGYQNENLRLPEIAIAKSLAGFVPGDSERVSEREPAAP
jgi:hypothetical protein